MLFLLAACLPLAAPALAEGGERPQIILMACYQQVGWGVYADAAFLDEEGGIWHYEDVYKRQRWRSTATISAYMTASGIYGYCSLAMAFDASVTSLLKSTVSKLLPFCF